MLDPKLIRESPDLVRSAIARKHLKVDLDAVLGADAAWRANLQAVEHLRAAQKAANSAMAALAKGSPEFAAKLGEMKAVSAQIKEREAGLKASEEAWRDAMLSLPNIPHGSVPEGRDAGGERGVFEPWDTGAAGRTTPRRTGRSRDSPGSFTSSGAQR